MKFDNLTEFGRFVADRAALALQLHGGAGDALEHLTPGVEQCRFCPASATCPAIAAVVRDAFDTVPSPDALTPADTLADAMPFVELAEVWANSVRAEVGRRLHAGQPVRGYKLVAGRAGARAWANPDEAEATLKAMRLPVATMYDLKLISPTTAEKLAKSKTIGPRQWETLRELITRTPGKPAIAREDDARPGVTPADLSGAFDVVPSE